MTSYLDGARMQSIRTRDQFDATFLRIVRDLMHNAHYYRRMARIARKRGQMTLCRELAIRAMTAEWEAHMMALDCHLTVAEIIGREA